MEQSASLRRNDSREGRPRRTPQSGGDPPRSHRAPRRRQSLRPALDRHRARRSRQHLQLDGQSAELGRISQCDEARLGTRAKCRLCRCRRQHRICDGRARPHSQERSRRNSRPRRHRRLRMDRLPSLRSTPASAESRQRPDRHRQRPRRRPQLQAISHRSLGGALPHRAHLRSIARQRRPAPGGHAQSPDRHLQLSPRVPGRSTFLRRKDNTAQRRSHQETDRRSQGLEWHRRCGLPGSFLPGGDPPHRDCASPRTISRQGHPPVFLEEHHILAENSNRPPREMAPSRIQDLR